MAGRIFESSAVHCNSYLEMLISYFVTRTVSDGKSAKDLKSINKSSENLFTCGHIQNIVMCAVRTSVLYIKCKCLPEMHKDRMYSISMALSSSSREIMQAECGCPAGRGPHGSYKHIAALCYAVVGCICMSTT